METEAQRGNVTYLRSHSNKQCFKLLSLHPSQLIGNACGDSGYQDKVGFQGLDSLKNCS